MKCAIGQRSRGLTLLELLVCGAIVAIVSLIAAPAYNQLRHDNALVGATVALATELRQIQTEATKRQTSASANIISLGTTWCMGQSIGTGCNCTVPMSCAIDGSERVTRSDSFTGITLTPNVSGGRFSFQPQRGTVTAGNIELASPRGRRLRVVVSGIGRIRICSPASSSPAVLPGYPQCV